MSSFFVVTRGERIAAKRQDSEGPEKQAEGITRGKGKNTSPWLAGA